MAKNPKSYMLSNRNDVNQDTKDKIIQLEQIKRGDTSVLKDEKVLEIFQLSELAKQLYFQILSQLESAQIPYGVSDLYIIVSLATTTEQIILLQQEINKLGLVILDGNNNPKTNPLISSQNILKQTQIKLSRELGLSVNERIKASASQAKDDNEDIW